MTKSLYAEFTAMPGKEDQVRAILQILAAEVRTEPGNIVFQPFTLSTDPRRFFVFEEYVDDAAFATHIAAEYGARFNAQLVDLIEGSGSELTWLNSIED
ncbi:putative quinol monooxygenase [Salinibacterium sp. G-O1]|uniref:putative quinol monooxygenase n=1 Tax=Salinibacterium sp. G-O1 TaxID=3046208 RepID=UPI0024BA564B|nr:putative quinol monooxygenase [Salinibacterium sp. G-O1]MDJ0334729.1 putative quinol monooxygenase [Salinibacterium sp. G-O1]